MEVTERLERGRQVVHRQVQVMLAVSWRLCCRGASVGYFGMLPMKEAYCITYALRPSLNNRPEHSSMHSKLSTT